MRLPFSNRTILALALITFASSAWVRAQTVSVNSATTYQTISGFGAASVWDSIATLRTIAVTLWHDDSGSPPASQANGQVGLSIDRILIDESGNANWATEAAAATLALSQNPNMRIFGTSWSPPAKWKNNNNTSGNNTGNDNGNPGSNSNQMNHTYWSNYAAYQTSWATAMKNNYGFTPYALSVQNEPDYDTNYQSCLWSASDFDTYIKSYLGPALAAAGFNPIIMMPESFADNLNLSATTMGDSAAATFVRCIGMHLYGGGPNTVPASYSTTAGHAVESWETEISDFAANDNSIASGLKYANQVHNCVVDHNFNAYVYWWILNLNTDNEGLYGPSQSTTPTKRLFALGNFSKFIRPNFVRIGCTEVPTAGVSVSAYYGSATNKVVIVAINNNTSAKSVTFNYSGLTVTTVYPWLTDASNNLVQQASVAVSGGSFSYSLPTQSVVSFVATTGGTPLPTSTPTVSPTRTNTAIPGAFCLVDDLEDLNTLDNWGGTWASYQGSASTINMSVVAGGATGSTAGCVSVTGTIGTNDYGGVTAPLTSGSGVTNLSPYYGVAFMVKGNGSNYWFQVPSNSVTTGDHYGVTFTAPAAWTPVTVQFSSMVQRGFGAGQPFDPTQVTALQWGGLSGTVNFQIDDVKMLGAYCPGGTPTPTFTATRTSTATPTRTNTATVTNSPTASSTATRTSTSTSTNTSSSTPTSTASRTPTASSTNTVANTATSTPSATATRTFTPTSSPTSSATTTNTPVNTATPSSTATRTNTPMNTATPTYSSTATNTPVNTATPSSTATRTNTPVNTVTPTNTSTLVNTATSSSTPSRTSTASATSTAVNSPTSTSSSTATNTPVNTATPSSSATRTNTSVFSPTSTFTSTWTDTFTSSSTPTPTLANTSTPTWTPTDTYTSTVTDTPTRSMTPTASLTASRTPTGTMSPSLTPTKTGTVTSTSTSTNTPVNTPTSTNTLVNTVTHTMTATATSTRTNTPTSSPTATLTHSPTASWTGTFSQTPTATWTSTSSWTPTRTSTRTATASYTSTPTASFTPTNTGTATPTFTATFTRTNTPVGNTVVLIYPNPDPGPIVTILPPAYEGVQDVHIVIFTPAFRKVLDIHRTVLSGTPIPIELKDAWGHPLADGLYYVFVSVDGRRSMAKLLILR